MYKVIFDYGSEGWSFADGDFSSAEDALDWAMASGYTADFKVVKVIRFKEAE